MREIPGIGGTNIVIKLHRTGMHSLLERLRAEVPGRRSRHAFHSRSLPG
jgi:hypothetical protein